MNMPKTYNEFSSWYYAQKLRNYYTLSRDDVDLIAQILLNGGCAQGDGTGFSLIDSEGVVIRRFNQNCLAKGLRYCYANRSKITANTEAGRGTRK